MLCEYRSWTWRNKNNSQLTCCSWTNNTLQQAIWPWQKSYDDRPISVVFWMVEMGKGLGSLILDYTHFQHLEHYVLSGVDRWTAVHKKGFVCYLYVSVSKTTLNPLLTRVLTFRCKAFYRVPFYTLRWRLMPTCLSCDLAIVTCLPQNVFWPLSFLPQVLHAGDVHCGSWCGGLPALCALVQALGGRLPPHRLLQGQALRGLPPYGGKLHLPGHNRASPHGQGA